jgi:Ser/Thr protein kinase RdoA (MazF antagonist)
LAKGIVGEVESSISGDVKEAVDASVRLATGSQVKHFDVLRQDLDYWIVAADTGAGDALVIKLAAPSASVPSFAAAKAKHDLVRGSVEIPMSQMLAGDDSCMVLPFRYSVQTKLFGEEWFTRRGQLDDPTRDRALAALGDVIGRLHTPIMMGFGALPGAEGSDGFGAICERSMSIIRQLQLRDGFLELLMRHERLWSGLVEPGITHDDLHGFNILFHPDRPTEVSGILDFDKAWSGPVESDLARMELWRGMTGRTFIEAYRARVPELSGYADRRPFYQLLWCLEFAQNTAEHLGTTNELALRLGMAPIEGFA